MTNVPNPVILIRQPKRLPWLKWLRRIHAWAGL